MLGTEGSPEALGMLSFSPRAVESYKNVCSHTETEIVSISSLDRVRIWHSLHIYLPQLFEAMETKCIAIHLAAKTCQNGVTDFVGALYCLSCLGRLVC